MRYDAAMRFFATSGPIVPERHYGIPPLSRIDLDGVLRLVREWRYFVLRAPRQSGKTSVLLALRDLLNGTGEYRCVYANVECGQTAREDIGAAMFAVLDELADRAARTLGDEFMESIRLKAVERHGPHRALRRALSRWAEADPRPLVLLLDEIDSLVGDALVSVLRQLRSGYDLRPRAFPQSVVLCGVRDVRDYRIHAADGKSVIAGGSAFNIKDESLRLGDFSQSDTMALLAQHTRETGQCVAPEAAARIWTQSQGQPWLVNALAGEACFRNERGRDRARTIVEADILDARERLILRRETHLDQLADKLREPRVRRIIEPLTASSPPGDSSVDSAEYARDIEYVRDLGLIAPNAPIRMANPVYAEVVPRELTAAAQEILPLPRETAWYVDPGGGLNVGKLIEAFQAFFRAHSEHWIQRFAYREAGPQLLLQAFLQRIVNGGGRIEREYGLGRGRVDLLVVWPWPDTGGANKARNYVIECKVLRRSLETTVRDGVAQTADYIDRCAASEGHLVVFDRRNRDWGDKIFHRIERTKGATVHVWGM